MEQPNNRANQQNERMQFRHARLSSSLHKASCILRFTASQWDACPAVGAHITWGPQKWARVPEKDVLHPPPLTDSAFITTCPTSRHLEVRRFGWIQHGQMHALSGGLKQSLQRWAERRSNPQAEVACHACAVCEHLEALATDLVQR